MALSHRLRPSLHGALVAVATVAMAMVAIAAAVVTVMQEVALLRWGNVMLKMQGCLWLTMLALAQLLNSLPVLALHCGANENTLHSALVIVATMAMAIMVAVAATVTREVALLRWGNKMMTCDSDRARVYTTDNAGTSATVE